MESSFKTVSRPESNRVPCNACTAVYHVRPDEPLSPTIYFPLCTESDLIVAPRRNDAKGQKKKFIGAASLVRREIMEILAPARFRSTHLSSIPA
jgi:hypothetical protein